MGGQLGLDSFEIAECSRQAQGQQGIEGIVDGGDFRRRLGPVGVEPSRHQRRSDAAILGGEAQPFLEQAKGAGALTAGGSDPGCKEQIGPIPTTASRSGESLGEGRCPGAAGCPAQGAVESHRIVGIDAQKVDHPIDLIA